MTNTNSK